MGWGCLRYRLQNRQARALTRLLQYQSRSIHFSAILRATFAFFFFPPIAVPSSTSALASGAINSRQIIVVFQSEDVRDDTKGRLVVLVHYELHAVGGELVQMERKHNSR